MEVVDEKLHIKECQGAYHSVVNCLRTEDVEAIGNFK